MFQLIHQLQERKYEAVNCEQFDNAKKLQHTIKELTMAGQAIGAMDAQKRAFAVVGKYEESKNKKVECAQFREKVYKELMISDLLELPLPRSKPPSAEGKELPPATRLKSQKGRKISVSGGNNEDILPPPPPQPVPPIKNPDPVIKKRPKSPSQEDSHEALKKEIFRRKFY